MELKVFGFLGFLNLYLLNLNLNCHLFLLDVLLITQGRQVFILLKTLHFAATFTCLLMTLPLYIQKFDTLAIICTKHCNK